LGKGKQEKTRKQKEKCANALLGNSYIGYYGVSLMSKSYIVLYGSLAAHLFQFLFLGFVENPRNLFLLLSLSFSRCNNLPM
jgi:hypothetical protein